jgi:hypothetical protein
MWTDSIESMVFTRVKTKGNKALKTEYPKLFYTTDNVTEDEPVFPACYIQELAGAERGRSLDGQSVNGILCTFQIDVSDNDKKANAKKVMMNAIDTFKEMRFEIIAFPTYRKEDGVWVGTARVRRIIGALDIL